MFFEGPAAAPATPAAETTEPSWPEPTPPAAPDRPVAATITRPGTAGAHVAGPLAPAPPSKKFAAQEKEQLERSTAVPRRQITSWTSGSPLQKAKPRRRLNPRLFLAGWS
jgi:hypothetical protein